MDSEGWRESEVKCNGKLSEELWLSGGGNEEVSRDFCGDLLRGKLMIFVEKEKELLEY
jgi:hypothetical protein